MTSVLRKIAQIPENKLYIVTSSSGVTLRDETDTMSLEYASVGWILRDMGKTVIFNPENPLTSYMMRKVQIVTEEGNGPTGYIRVGGQTYGGDGIPSGVALLY